jgi:hypothetical protein
MTDSTIEDGTSRRGFSSRWILDESKQRTQIDPASAPEPHSVAPAPTSGKPSPVQGSSVAARVEPAEPRRSIWRSIGSWTGRSILTVVFVTALVAAGMAVTAAYTTREQLDDLRADIAATDVQLESVRDDLETARSDLAAATADDMTAAADVAAAETRRDELQLEVDVLRRMLLASEQTTDAG